jgi:hypothetical protein
MIPDLATQALNHLMKLFEALNNFYNMMLAVSIFGFIFFALPIIVGWIIYHVYEDYFIECAKKLEKILIAALKN